MRKFFQRKGVKIALAVLVVVLLAGGAFTGGFLTGRNSILPVTPETIIITPEEAKEFSPLIETWSYLKQYFYGELPPIEKFIEGAIKGGIKELDPELAEYTYYFNPIRARVVQAEMEGRFAGVGVRITQENAEIVIMSLIPGGPAEKSGKIKPGDRVTAIDGASITGEPWDKIHSLFRGEPGTEIKLSIYRQGTREEIARGEAGNLEVTLTREIISTPSVQTSIRGEGKLGYISLEIFDEKSANEVRDALRQLLEVDKVQGLILDLRGNPGGRQTASIQILSQFIPGGKVAVRIITREGSYTLATHPGGLALDIPLVVLIDQGSASASELVAAAIKEYDRGILVGTTTTGKGVGQQGYPLSDGSLIDVVSHEFRSPEGRIIHGVGVQPDSEFFVPTNPIQRRLGRDPALERAEEELLRQLATSSP